MSEECILGIDTSNYKTSLAIVGVDGKIFLDERLLLRVRHGERGLRQSEALFQHVENLPVLFDRITRLDLKIVAVAISNRPRPIEGSYMPCFKAGYGFGKAIASTLRVPFFEFSHQEGHIEAIKHYTTLCDVNSVLAWHLSGGTCELLSVCGESIEIVGGSKDISFGQVIDRVGVLLGMRFPAGEEMDLCALQGKEMMRSTENTCSKVNNSQILSKIKTEDLHFNLSGIETQCSRFITGNSEFNQQLLIKELFDRIVAVLCTVTAQAADKLEISDVIFAGGVSCSEYISRGIEAESKNKGFKVEFGNQNLSGDNAVGIALLGMKKWNVRHYQTTK